LDTGIIVALLDRSERNHARCVAAVKDLEQPLVTCEAVIAESCYLLRDIHGAPEAILEMLRPASSKFRFRFPVQPQSFAALCRSIETKLQLMEFVSVPWRSFRIIRIP
jgi:predicted nucleic acid-binding protein